MPSAWSSPAARCSLPSVGLGDVFPVDPVAHRAVPVDVPHQGVQEIGGVAHRVDAADEAADARSHDHVHRELVLFQVLERAHGSRPLGAAAAQDEGQRGPALPDPFHPGLHLGDGLLVGRVQAEAGGRGGLRRQDRGSEQEQEKQISLHGTKRGCAARPGGRRRRRCPRPGTRGWWR